MPSSACRPTDTHSRPANDGMRICQAVAHRPQFMRLRTWEAFHGKAKKKLNLQSRPLEPQAVNYRLLPLSWSVFILAQ